METTIFGLPVTTVAVFTGVPVLIAALLVWWGVSYRKTDDANTGRENG